MISNRQMLCFKRCTYHFRARYCQGRSWRLQTSSASLLAGSRRNARFCSLLSSHDIHIERNVRYSSNHPRNVMDIYSPNTSETIRKDNVPTLLFVHGGMWLRGSKEQNALSIYDMASHMVSQAYTKYTYWQDSSSDVVHDSGKETNDKYLSNNLGLCVAQHGGIACVMNYRLAGSFQDGNINETGHPHQVMDVARAITFLVNKSIDDGRPLQLFIGGHSAGAHLAALVLSDPQYLHKAMAERNLDHALIRRFLKGFIGISGVYNLRRLAMSPLAAVTVVPAFGQGKQDGSDVTLDASPVQVLLQTQNSNLDRSLPHLATIPVLLLNADSDFHLAQDTADLLVALDSLSTGTRDSQERLALAIPNRNHLSIMGEFGCGMIDEATTIKTDPGNDERNYLSFASNYLTSYFASSTNKVADEASTTLLQFMNLLK